MVAPGDLLQNRYRVLHALGKGGFGQVFEVEDHGVPKVLKVLDLSAFQASQHPKVIQLFRREVEILSQIHHPGVPQLDGYFVIPQQPPLHCLVMEKISGVNLQQWLQAGGVLTQAQAIDWLKQLVQILIHLHQQQVFHRDIKPANIMLRPEGQLVLVDFGAVRQITPTYLAKQQQQATGTAIISAGYTPPEQAEGQAVPQSDFFAMGRTFVYLFTGKDPIDLPKHPQTGQLIWRDRPLKPAQLSPLFLELIDHLMAPFPGQRPQSGEAILQVIQKIERQLFLQRWFPLLQPLAQIRQNLGVGDRVWFSSNALRTTLIGVLLTGVVVWSNRIQISDAINDRGLAAHEAKSYQLARRYYQLALVFDPGSPIASFNLGNLYEDWRQFGQARAAYQVAIAGKQWKAFNNLARLNILDGHYEEAIPLLEQGLQLTEFPEDRYFLFKNLGWAQFGLKQYDKAQTTLQQAINLNPRRAAPHCLMALVLLAKVKNPNALAEKNLCFHYADLQNPDDRTLSDVVDLVRSAFPPPEVQH